jgi:hypothetical protein
LIFTLLTVSFPIVAIIPGDPAIMDRQPWPEGKADFLYGLGLAFRGGIFSQA